ncbi:hypothetical protein R3I94_004975 [Phoxinus phoxinus]
MLLPGKSSPVAPASTPAPPLSYSTIDIDQCVREAWEGKKVYVLLSKLGPFNIFFEDIRKTAPSLQIESEVMIPKEQRVLYLDPLGERQPDLKRCQEVTRSFMNEKGIHVSTWACDTLPHPHQKDSSSCGAFVLKFAECMLEKKPVLFSTSTTSVTMGLTDWIGCDVCPRWYHCDCAKTSMEVTNYLCPACNN